MDGWVGGWGGGWVDGKARLRIAYSNQQIKHHLKYTLIVLFYMINENNSASCKKIPCLMDGWIISGRMEGRKSGFKNYLQQS